MFECFLSCLLNVDMFLDCIEIREIIYTCTRKNITTIIFLMRSIRLHHIYIYTLVYSSEDNKYVGGKYSFPLLFNKPLINKFNVRNKCIKIYGG